MYKLNFTQKLPISIDDAWDFFSTPENLEKITPSSLGFKITELHDNRKMYTGQLIAYTVQPIWKIRLKWITEITAVQKPDYFIDEQKLGPYAFWHHEHWYKSIPGGIEMEDLIYYDLPYGLLGKVLHRIKIKRDLEGIFAYRQTVLEKTFGAYKAK